MSVPAMTPALRRVPQTPDDEPFLAELYAACRADELAPAGWDEATVAAFCAQQHAAREDWYATAFPGARATVLLVDDEPAGRLLTWRGDGTTHVVDVAVHPRHRGHGLGTAALRAVLDEADGPVRLVVRRDNPARRLYERLGFRPVAHEGFDLTMEAHA
jgi:ribosomal protein S18 acetylase RimI-like enzyme